MKNIFRSLKTKDKIDSVYATSFWRVLTVSFWLTAGAAAIVGGLGAPTGLGLFWDLVLYFTVHVLLFSLTTKLFSLLLSLLPLPLPRIFLSSMLYTGLLVYFLLRSARTTVFFAVIIAVSYVLLSFVLGLVLNFFVQKKFPRKYKFVLLILLTVLIVVLSAGKEEQRSWSDVDIGEPSHLICTNLGSNPGRPGPYNILSFTYGSGRDKHRREFGTGTDLLTPAVDAALYIKAEEWPLLRTYFWGFTETNLPLNGRVWMPEGQGTFPLVLFVHGNHTMEYFSDAGYAYLGELLASRGYIAVSIDENFLNYSHWSGIPDDDMKVRAWLLMQHLLQIQKFNATPGNPFYQKVDLQKIALAGHSRGGQAAAMAADYRRWFAGDPSLSGFENLKIQAVIALAPTDTTIDGKKTRLHDVSYLVLHGGQDADVNTFAGDKQYARCTFSPGSEKFKASLYIGEANHSHFNTQWGSLDISLPQGLFLNRRTTLAAEAQRQITSIYLAAFLDFALKGDKQYLPLFLDWRCGRSWLPQAYYVTRFESGKFVPLITFNRQSNKEKFSYGVTAAAGGFSTCEIAEALDRRGKGKGYFGLILAWEQPATYTIHVSETFRRHRLAETPTFVVFSLANLPKELTEAQKNLEPPQVEVEITGNVSVRLPLSAFQPIPRQFYTQYTILPFFDQIMKKDKYKEAAEAVLQTYAIPLQTLQKINPDFNPDMITKITLYFPKGPGKIMLEKAGFSSLTL
ncbi:MAG: alpha/beta hydrolase [Firmicutes bacterium]|nr:alpha/beta hydrolase [Bacillota bacterium]